MHTRRPERAGISAAREASLAKDPCRKKEIKVLKLYREHATTSYSTSNIAVKVRKQHPLSLTLR